MATLVTHDSKNVNIESMEELIDFIYMRKEQVGDFQTDDMVTAVLDYLNSARCENCGHVRKPIRSKK